MDSDSLNMNTVWIPFIASLAPTTFCQVKVVLADDAHSLILKICQNYFNSEDWDFQERDFSRLRPVLWAPWEDFLRVFSHVGSFLQYGTIP